ncbi:MAG TPA: hypothetical protein VFU10_00415 [Gaiellaceae bacterium]|nr:hypothetical protein [Gaiellaceae bacterium]
MNPAALRDLVLAQVSFFGFLLVAALLTDQGFMNNHGPSYYGEHVRTAVPFGLGLALSAGFTWRAAVHLDEPFAQALRVLAVLFLLDLATPDTVDGAFYWTHVAVSAALFPLELGIAAAIVHARRAPVLIVLLAVQLAAGLVAMFSQLHAIGFLSEGIVAYQLAFGLLLIVAAARPAEGLVGAAPNTAP